MKKYIFLLLLTVLSINNALFCMQSARYGLFRSTTQRPIRSGFGSTFSARPGSHSPWKIRSYTTQAPKRGVSWGKVAGTAAIGGTGTIAYQLYKSKEVSRQIHELQAEIEKAAKDREKKLNANVRELEKKFHTFFPNSPITINYINGLKNLAQEERQLEQQAKELTQREENLNKQKPYFFNYWSLSSWQQEKDKLDKEEKSLNEKIWMLNLKKQFIRPDVQSFLTNILNAFVTQESSNYDETSIKEFKAIMESNPTVFIEMMVNSLKEAEIQ